MLIELLLAQAALVVPPVPTRHSILATVGSTPCVRRKDGDEVVVCADALPDQTLPLPDQAVSTRPVPVNRDLTGTGALDAEESPCATVVGGCQVGLDIFGAATAAIRGVQKLVAPNSCCERPGESTNPFMLVGDVAHGVAAPFLRKPKKQRVTIDLDEPSLTGRVRP